MTPEESAFGCAASHGVVPVEGPPKPGMEFIHLSMLDPRWRPGPGERYAHAPKARMRITRVTGLAVYFTYAWDPAGGRAAGWVLPRGDFETRYGDWLLPKPA